MAKILSPIDSVRRGSVAGTTYTANKYSAIVARARVVPVNPQTGPQNLVRNAFKEACDRWRSVLTAAERTTWGLAASYMPYAGPLGTYYVGGRNLFIAAKTFLDSINRFNPALITADDNSIGTFGGWINLGTVGIVAPGTAGTGFDVGFTRVDGMGDVVSTIQISPALNNTVNYFTGPFLPGIYAGASTPEGQSTVIPVRNLIAGYKYFVKVRAMLESNGSNFSQSFIFPAVASTFV